jgi:hypothetical protein
MAAPKSATYAPKSGLLAGRVFVGTPGTSQAYNRYQEARAHRLGFSSYADQRKARQSPALKGLLTSEQNRLGRKPPQNIIDRLMSAFAQNRRMETVVERGKPVRTRQVLDVNQADHTRGGSLDRYLIAIGRRTGNELWLPGETP